VLKRKAYEQLKEWRAAGGKQGLLVTGARQVGKTFLVRAFAAEFYPSFAEINLIENRRAAAILDAAENADDLFLRISSLAETELIPGETLIFLDEVQVCKELVTALKFLVERGDYDFVLSGSLLGVELKSIRSVPVGYLDTVTMYPLDFAEFCQARGVAANALSLMCDAFLSRSALPDYLHEKFLSLFHEYLIVGGMPAVVAEFCATRNLQTVRRLQANLILQNKLDISKYNEKDSLIIKDIYDLIPSELNQQNKRFILKNMNEHARFNRYQECFIWLKDAGVALPVYNVSAPVYPLKLSQASNLFKLFLADVGLLTGMFLQDVSLDILSRNPNVNYGSIYENAVAQELAAGGWELYYYKNKKRGEIDFLLETKDGKIMPLEVKSGKDYQRHNALSNLLATEEFKITEAFVLSEANLSAGERVTYLPIYLIGCLS
jgi:predicted AAA+ superfamily ATPase